MAASATKQSALSRAPGNGRGRPRSSDKSRAILDAAAARFLELGYERTSMDEVARKAGVSKQTVYSHFVNKERLFRAVVADRVAAYFPAEPTGGSARTSVEAELRALARQYMRLSLSAEAIAMFRLLAANAESHPRMVQLFFEEGPARLHAAVETTLSEAASRGRIACDEPATAAALLSTLLRGEIFLQRALGLVGEIDDATVDSHVEACLAIFFRLYPPQNGRRTGTSP